MTELDKHCGKWREITAIALHSEQPHLRQQHPRVTGAGSNTPLPGSIYQIHKETLKQGHTAFLMSSSTILAEP